ncbi:hypothetical protein JRX38_14135 [Gluconobacter cerinus]|uniref:hypothetical protein n=1 Tax=Gluconobacter cerinus TaxID=38307 RepID=UPI00193F448B|nr:hypothetical protein [Gluconobacter cerinus]MBM3099126.1 hypothetical protein [Gluconobacter cerinus]
MRRLSFLTLAAICSVAAASAQTVPTKPSDHGVFDGGKFPASASGIITHMDLSGALSGYVTQTALNTALDAYLPLTGGQMAGDITFSNIGAGAGETRFGGSQLYGQFSVPGSGLTQGTALAWNSLSALPGASAFGETDFYNLQGLGPGGFSWCSGTTVSNCQANVLMTLAGNGVSFSKSANISGNVSVSGTATLTAAAGTGNAYACLNTSGQLYRSSSACN